MSHERNLARLAETGAPVLKTAQELRDMPIYNNIYPEAVVTLGALAAGDGGGGSWYWDATSSEADNLGTVVMPAGFVQGTDAGRWLRVFDGKTFNIVWFGGVLDGATDSSQAYLDVLAASDVENGAVYIPGNIRILQPGFINSRTHDFLLYGDGMYQSQIWMNVDKETPLTCLDPVTKINITLRDICIRGNVAANPANVNYQRGINVRDCGHLRVERCRFFELQHNGITGMAQSLHCSDSVFYKICSGPIGNIQVIDYAKVINNFMMHGADDSVGIHAYSATTKDPEYKHARTEIVVSGNTIIDGIGINVLGSKNTVITNNTGFRVKTRWIRFGYDATYDVGRTSQNNVTIANNVLRDFYTATVLDPVMTANEMLKIIGPPTTNTPNGVKPGQPLPGGGVEDPLPYIRNIGTKASATGAIAPNYNMIVANNTFSRTNTDGELYEDLWGIQMWSMKGFQNPNVDGKDCRGHADIYGSLTNLSISNNVFSKCYMTLTANDDTGLDNILVSQNTFYGTRVYVLGNNNRCNFIFKGNRFDIDPWYELPDHNNDGTWANVGAAYALNIRDAGNGILLIENHFLNCSRPVFTHNSPITAYDNFLYGEFVQDGDNAANKGIRYPNRVSQGYIPIHYDADTTSPTWNTILTNKITGSLNMPTTGNWMKGEFVRNMNVPNPNANGNILYGWLRKTSGNAHVLGTDWYEIYYKTTS
jgi:hypothetical protein